MLCAGYCGKQVEPGSPHAPFCSADCYHREGMRRPARWPGSVEAKRQQQEADLRRSRKAEGKQR